MRGRIAINTRKTGRLAQHFDESRRIDVSKRGVEVKCGSELEPKVGVVAGWEAEGMEEQ